MDQQNRAPLPAPTDEAGPYSRAAGRFAVLLDPPHVSGMLFGPDFALLTAAGGIPALPRPLTNLDTPDARAALAEIDILITGWGAPVLTDALLDAAPHLRFVLHAGGQASHFLPPSIVARGIGLSNAGWINAIPVAEFTYAMVVLVNKGAFRARNLYRQEQRYIDREREFAQAGNRGRIVGLVGASRIGRIVLERLGDLEVDVLLHDPYVEPGEAKRLGARLVGLDELMSTSHVVSLHPPLNAQTQGMITARHLALMPDGATLINTARGLVVDQEALLMQLRCGRIDAVLDVTEPDVLPAGHELYSLPNVFLTPHISGSMGAEIGRMGAHVAGELGRIVRGQPLAMPERAP